MVSDTFHHIGDRRGDLARGLGSGTVDIARRVGDTTVDIARRVGDGTVDIARRVGTRRALIGVAVAVAMIGGSMLLIRFLRARRAERGTGTGAGIDRGEEAMGDVTSSTSNDRSRSSMEGRVY